VLLAAAICFLLLLCREGRSSRRWLAEYSRTIRSLWYDYNCHGASLLTVTPLLSHHVAFPIPFLWVFLAIWCGIAVRQGRLAVVSSFFWA